MKDLPFAATSLMLYPLELITLQLLNELECESNYHHNTHCVLCVWQVSAADHRGLTALHHASSQGLEGVLVALLERGADPEVSPLPRPPLVPVLIVSLSPFRSREASCSTPP